MPDILMTKRDDVGLVSLNRPEAHNAVKLAMWHELADVFENLAGDDAVRAVVLTGAGANFCVGADVTEFNAIRENKDQSAAYETAVDACTAAIADVQKPVIAAISGYCLGGGCHLALACDFRFAELRVQNSCSTDYRSARARWTSRLPSASSTKRPTVTISGRAGEPSPRSGLHNFAAADEVR